MNLSVAWVGEKCATLVSAVGRSDVAPSRVGREIKDVPVTARGQNDGIPGMRRDFSVNQISNNNPFGVPIYND
jgi:hypothetical protein